MSSKSLYISKRAFLFFFLFSLGDGESEYCAVLRVVKVVVLAESSLLKMWIGWLILQKEKSI
jgi:hypothetical protein